MVQKCITLKKEHVEYIVKKGLSLSKFVQIKLEEEIKKDE
tara:strand:- start:2689 stop:2808 length:120 start_codon:yes stop_codon:yes gene_type:complete